MKRAVALSLATVLATALPTASAQPSAAGAEQRILMTFMQVGTANTRGEANFDYTAFKSHPCFDVVGAAEHVYCQMLFGPYADLKGIMLDGTLARMLTPVTAAVPSKPATIVVNTTPPAPMRQPTISSFEAERQRIQDRTNLVWSECKRLFGAGNQIGCYQSNIRLVRDRGVEIKGNVRFNRPQRTRTAMREVK